MLNMIQTVDVDYVIKSEPSVIRQGRVAFVSEAELSVITALSYTSAPEGDAIRRFDSGVWLYVVDNKPSWEEMTDENNEYHFVVRSRKES